MAAWGNFSLVIRAANRGAKLTAALSLVLTASCVYDLALSGNFKCNDAGQCKSGYACQAGVCVSVPEGGLPQPQCSSDQDCPPPQRCLNGSCQPACAQDQDCSEGEVCQDGQCLIPEVDSGTQDTGEKDAKTTDGPALDVGYDDAGDGATDATKPKDAQPEELPITDAMTDVVSPVDASDVVTPEENPADVPPPQDVPVTDGEPPDGGPPDGGPPDGGPPDGEPADVQPGDEGPQDAISCATGCQFQNGVGRCIAGQCALVQCTPGFINCDGDDLTGCETPCVSTNGGVEICDLVDNDCNCKVDDGIVKDTPDSCGELCKVCTIVNGVADCVNGACAFKECLPGHTFDQKTNECHCVASSECGPDKRCDLSGTCVPKNPAIACYRDSDCASDYPLCDPKEFFCFKSDGSCIDRKSGHDAHCRSGFDCNGTWGKVRCHCKSDADCPHGLSCKNSWPDGNFCF